MRLPVDRREPLIVLRGSLEKRAKGLFKRWQPRFFETDGTQLTYRASEAEAFLGGVFLLGDVCAITAEDGELTVTGPNIDVSAVDSGASSSATLRTLKLRQVAGGPTAEEWKSAMLSNRRVLRSRALHTAELAPGAHSSDDNEAEEEEEDDDDDDAMVPATAEPDVFGWCDERASFRDPEKFMTRKVAEQIAENSGLSLRDTFDETVVAPATTGGAVDSTAGCMIARTKKKKSAKKSDKKMKDKRASQRMSQRMAKTLGARGKKKTKKKTAVPISARRRARLSAVRRESDAGER